MKLYKTLLILSSASIIFGCDSIDDAATSLKEDGFSSERTLNNAKEIIANINLHEFSDKIGDVVSDTVLEKKDGIIEVIEAAEAIGFVVEEFRFQAPNPTAEIFFKDVGDTGQYEEVIANLDGSKKQIIKALQKGRTMQTSEYTLKRAVVTLNFPRSNIKFYFTDGNNTPIPQ